MLTKILRSVVFGLITAVILLIVMPTLRISGNFITKHDPSDDEIPISYNHGVRRAVPAVVNVYSRRLNNGDVTKLGSGVIMNSTGYILTNKHVINDTAEQPIVALQDGRILEAMLVGSDSLTDLAVLKITSANLPAIPINPKRVVHVGDVVMAIGNPYNLGQTVTQGIISATGRVSLSTSGRQNFLQTDASINRGNSGGALVNSLGELVGINTLSFDKSSDGRTPEGIGFAIPAALAIKIMNKLIRDGRVIRGFIGITGRDVPKIYDQVANIEHIQGVTVSEVTLGGPAAKAGIEINDVIINIDHKSVASAQETMDQVAEIHPGTTIEVQVIRNGSKLTLPLTIIEYPQQN